MFINIIYIKSTKKNHIGMLTLKKARTQPQMHVLCMTIVKCRCSQHINFSEDRTCIGVHEFLITRIDWLNTGVISLTWSLPDVVKDPELSRQWGSCHTWCDAGSSTSWRSRPQNFSKESRLALLQIPADSHSFPFCTNYNSKWLNVNQKTLQKERERKWQ